jgi:hypothetical protein
VTGRIHQVFVPRFEIQNTMNSRMAPKIAFGCQPDCGSKSDVSQTVVRSHSDEASGPARGESR